MPNLSEHHQAHAQKSQTLRKTKKLGKVTRVTPNRNGVVERIGTITQMTNAAPIPDHPSGHHFTGIHTISRKAIEWVAENSGLSCIVRTAYCELIPQGKVGAHIHNGQWVDAGTPDDYLTANLLALNGKISLSIDQWAHANRQYEGCWVSTEAQVKGKVVNTIVGDGAFVPRTASLRDCVVWDGVNVPDGEHVQCIFFGDGQKHQGKYIP